MKRIIFAMMLAGAIPISANATACSSNWSWENDGVCADLSSSGTAIDSLQAQIPNDGSRDFVRLSQESLNGAGLSICFDGVVDNECLVSYIIQRIKTFQTALSAATYTNEQAQDTVGGALSAEFNYNDAGNSFALRAKSFTNGSTGRSLTTSTGSSGFQPSASRDALVSYSVTITTAVQIGLTTNVDGYAVLEIAPTNSVTAGDWVEIARTSQAQNVGLALALSSAQKGGGNLTGGVPAGYYAKIRTVNVAGTPTYALNSGQEVLF